MIYSLPAVTITGTTPGTVDWSQFLGAAGADFVRLANWTANALIVSIAGRQYILDPWTADLYPGFCKDNLRYEPQAVSAAAGLPFGATATLLVTIAYGEPIPGVYPLPLSVATLSLDAAGGDVLPLVGGDDAAVAGSVALAPHADHQHPASTTGAINETVRAVPNVRLGVLSASPRLILDAGTGVGMWEIDHLNGDLRFFTPGSVKAVLHSGTGILAVLAGVGNADTSHWHPHNHAGHTHQGQYQNIQTGGAVASAGPAIPTITSNDHTHAFNDPSAGTNPGATTTSTTPATDTTLQNQGHTHKG